MNYFTRQRYQAIQGDSRKAEREWDKACDAYRDYLASILSQLPPGSRDLAENTFHDGIIKELNELEPGSLQITIDASHNPWGPRGNFQLQFIGVSSLIVDGTVVGDWWLYEELHLLEHGFALHVLLETSEIIVEAADVTILPAVTTS
ncbi:MAG: DUF4085 family protein [Anaerolineae bacterium]|nr:DUF4085 family protein [Anaerolineae bacterium]